MATRCWERKSGRDTGAPKNRERLILAGFRVPQREGFFLKKLNPTSVTAYESPQITGVEVAGQEIGDRMDAIITEYEAPLLRYASGLLRDPHAAQDVVQNAFIKLFRQWAPGKQPAESLRPWLYRVTHNEAMDYLRSRKRLAFLHWKQAQEPVQAPDPAGDERIEQVLAAVRRLEVHEQQVVLLRLQEGLSYEDIARVTGRTTGNVGCILHHAVKKLSRLVQRETPASGRGVQP